MALLAANHNPKTVQKAAALEEQHNLVHNGANVLLGQVDSQVGILRRLVRVVDAGEARNLPGARPLVDAPAVRPLAVLERRRDVHQEKGPRLLDKLARVLAVVLVRRDRGRDDGGARPRELRRHKGDAPNVPAPVLPAEAQLRRQLGAHRLAQQHRHGPPAALVERGLQSARNLVLAAVLVARQEDGEALFARQRVLLAQHLHHLRMFMVRVPSGISLAGRYSSRSGM
ncbi:hypothetical protein Trco_003626 [Trichoderma cornu-damae]|uniref:Uncharacterized protein n=1 Tax=Trichoderma cornu-damae TaxID=654480 RepID=A0A9P8TWC1_9HYPO|nr:hypothetical protein Trco_003626 [Trichoderma cornu-damae]